MGQDLEARSLGLEDRDPTPVNRDPDTVEPSLQSPPLSPSQHATSSL
uniref:Uncharacterized protein n=1 Tax=Manihot esculenta TaxID=3983 RepID=A0A2C9VXX7_MANES